MAVGAAAKDLSQNHAGEDVARGVAGLAALLLAAVGVEVRLGAVERGLSGCGRIAGEVQRRAQIPGGGVLGLSIKAGGISKRHAGLGAHDASARRQ